MRNYMMERLLERISLTSYRDRFILKGGMLVSALVGIDIRSTMDMDTTLKGLPLTIDSVERILNEICSFPFDDGVSFEIKSYPVQPVIEVLDNAFKMTLPNTNYHRQSDLSGEKADDAYKDDERKAVRYLENHPHIDRKEVEQALGFSQAKTIRLLNLLAEKGAIKMRGKGGIRDTPLRVRPNCNIKLVCGVSSKDTSNIRQVC